MNFNRGKLTELLKDGSTQYSKGVTAKNIEAVKKLSNITRTSMGPNGLNKMVINHIGKLFVTHDASTIVRELEVVHPAAKIVAQAAASMEQELGDGTNTVISLAAELLKQAERLLKMGLHSSDVIQGYKKAYEQAVKIMEGLVVSNATDVKDKDQVCKALKAAVSAKELSYANKLVPIIADACITVCPKDPKKFSVDNVRVVKIAGGSILDTEVIKGFVLKRDVSGYLKHKKNCKIAVFNCSIDSGSTETKGVIELENAKELLDYNKTEEEAIEKDIKAIAESGANVVVSKGSFGELALHYIERYDMMAVKVTSKFDLRRLCRAIGAHPLVRIGAPSADELGYAANVDVEEIGGTKCIIFKQDKVEDTMISTVIVRGATQNAMDEIERAIDDGVNVFKTMTKDSRLVAGCGAFELELYKQLTSFGEQVEGLDQYSVIKYAESMQIVPRTLLETSGFDATKALTILNAKHQKGEISIGVDIDDDEGLDAVKEGYLDCFSTKKWALKFATDAAISILSVDMIIMARPAGGPKPRQVDGRDWDTEHE